MNRKDGQVSAAGIALAGFGRPGCPKVEANREKSWMQYNKAMIDLVFQIRRAAPEDIRSQIKLSDPNLLTALPDAYPNFADSQLRNMVLQLLKLAGPSWEAEIQKRERPESGRMYRGQATELIQQKLPRPTTSRPKTIIYRGRVIATIP